MSGRLSLSLLAVSVLLLLFAVGYRASRNSSTSMSMAAANQPPPLPSLPALDAPSYCAKIGAQAVGATGQNVTQACLASEEVWLVTLKYRLAEGVVTDDDLRACQTGLYGLNRSYEVFAKCVQLRRPDHQSLSFKG